MKPGIRIITDDFTSAMDGTAGFAKRGFATALEFSDAAADNMEVVAVDTEGRITPRDQACELVRRCARQWTSARYLVKQFDSTLRGHVAHECVAALEASERTCLLLAPAFPEAGRTTVGGVVLVDGLPVHRTAFAADPLDPVYESNMGALFAKAGIGLELAENAEQAERLLARSSAVCVNVSRELQLDALVQCSLQRPNAWKHVLWAGSTGLLRAMSRVIRPAREPRHIRIPPVRRPAVVVGSLNPRSRTQLCELRRQGSLPFEVVETPQERGDPRVFARSVARKVSDLIRGGHCDAVVVTGGETARHVASALGVAALCVVDEVRPGVAVGLADAAGRTLPFITKAGGFGRDDALVRCVRYLLFGAGASRTDAAAYPYQVEKP